MHFTRANKDHLTTIFTIAVVWAFVCVLFVTFRYAGIDREIRGTDISYFIHDGIQQGVSTISFDVELRRAYFEFILGGFLCGLLAGTFEVLILPKSLIRQRFLTIVAVKIFFYVVGLIATVLLVLPVSIMLIQHSQETFSLQFQRQINEFFSSSLFPISLLLVAVTALLTTVFRLLASRLGYGVIIQIITGKYHVPKEEQRVFMFLDMKDSTAIAEHLGHLTFSVFLKDYFYEISDAIYRNGGEIEQYVGDEVVITWPEKESKSGMACIQCHFDVLARLDAIGPAWQKKYGVAPTAKSGIHIGKVVTTEVGVFKQEVVYLGDVVNTAARIQAECNKYHKSILVSGEFMQQLQLPENFLAEWMGYDILRGKEHRVELFSIAMLG